jgi:Spy/CpxP family protein refolding chaperone
MKNPLILFAAGALALTLSAPAFAAEGAGTPGAPAKSAKAAKAGKGAKGGGRMKAALEKLNLTAEQKPKVDKAFAAYQADVKKIRDGAGTNDEKKPKLRAASRAFQTQLSTILTSEQQQKLKEMRKQRPGATGAPKTPAKPKV